MRRVSSRHILSKPRLGMALGLWFAGVLVACMLVKPHVSPLFTAVENRDQIHLLALLKTHSGDLNQRYFGRTPLHMAAVINRVDLAAILLEGGAKIDVPDEVGNTALHVAVFCQRIAMVDYLLSQGAEVNLRNYFGSTPLRVATYVGAGPQIIESLLNNGADPALLDGKGRTTREVGALESSP